jgi:pimeloyl-ACP methyl ester carboxylesterase
MKDKYMKLNDLDIHFDKVGQGFPLLCLSGFGCSNYNFELLKEFLGEKYELILVDNRGMGKSSPMTSEYEISDLAKDAQTIMKSLGHTKYGVMGISMGGFIAQEVTSHFPDQVQFLILACTTSNGNEFPRLIKLNEESIRKSYQVDAELRSQLVLNATVHASLKEKNPERFEKIHQLRVSNTPDMDQLLLQQKAVDKFLDEEIDLTSFKCPTLIITGENDRLVTPKNVEIFRSKIKHAEEVYIQEADHHFFLEKPLETAKEVMKFMEKNI